MRVADDSPALVALPHAAASKRSSDHELPEEPGSGQGRRHGTSSSEPFDRWFRYPAGLASDYAAMLLNHLDVPRRGLIVDPFAGSAVVGTAALAAGNFFSGIEAHPLVAELAVLKLQPLPGDPGELQAWAADIARAAEMRASTGAVDDSAETDLVTRSFAHSALTRLIAARELIRGASGSPWLPYGKWALLATLREVATVRVGWPYQRPSVARRPRYTNPLERFVQRIATMVADVGAARPFRESADIAGQVTCGDARDAASWQSVAAGSAHGCMSSPPYLNNFDYADATRLELYFWGDVTSWAQLCSTVRIGMITATTQQAGVRQARAAHERIGDLGSVGAEILHLTRRLEIERQARSRGKEYDRVVPDYFAGLAQVLGNLAVALRENAPCVWLIGDSAPYGVYVDTPALVGRLAELYGFRVEGDRVLRHRGQRWTANSARHQVALTERLLIMRRTSGLAGSVTRGPR